MGWSAFFKRSARQRASRIACDAPLEPTGYIGCAASPSSVMRPLDQYGNGSRSQQGYSQNSGVAPTSAAKSTWGIEKPATWGINSSRLPRFDQSSRRGGGAEPSPIRTKTAQLVRRLAGLDPSAIG